MPQVRKVLIADPDLESVRALSRALRQKGFQVHYAPDGSRALEVAVLRHPDLVLFDAACRLLDWRTFVNILRSNPRTDDIPVVLTTASVQDADALRTARDGFLKKPFNPTEVLGRIEHLLRRSDAAKDLRAEAEEIEGSLGQLGIPDLMQILGMNRRSGRLALERGSERGELWVAEGRPVNARLGRVEGEKALFRMLAWTEGTFTFTPGTPPGKPRINRTTDDALLEGMRHADETARLVQALPPRHTRLLLAPDAPAPTDVHPVTAQVMELLRQPRTLADLVDLAPAVDLEVLGALTTLLQKGVVRVAEGEAEGEGPGPLLEPAELHALRNRLLHGRATARTAVAKIFVCAGAAGPLRRLLSDLPGVATEAAESPAVKSGFGTLGRVEVGELVRVDLCCLPHAEAARPLWKPFGAGAVGVLLLDDSEQAVRVAQHLAWEGRVPVAVVGQVVPAPLQEAPAGAAAVGADYAAALRSLLVQALHPAPLPGQPQPARTPPVGV